MKTSLYLLLSPVLFLTCTNVENALVVKPEKQVSFALEEKSHAYYVQQAELWWTEVKRDTTSEEAWFNYYRACRNAQGTADWREDFVNESPNLMLGMDIVQRIEKCIPNSFTLHYIKGSTGAVDPTFGPDLLKAYAMNPDFYGIQAAMVTYAVSTLDTDLRKEVNLKWKSLDYMHPGLLQYAKNVLAPLPPNAILITQHDNDSYPAWMLQDAYDFRPDVLVLNIDFLLLEPFRKHVFKTLNIPPFAIDQIDVDEYRKNWKNVVQHLLGHYQGDRPLYLGLTVSEEWYEGFENELQLYGLTNAFLAPKIDTDSAQADIFQHHWDLSDLNADYPQLGQGIVKALNQNYETALERARTYFLEKGDTKNADRIKGYIEEL